MAARDPNHDAGSHRLKSPLRAAAELIGIYIAMYLAVGGVLRIVDSPDAVAAIAPDTSLEASAAAVVANCLAARHESSASEATASQATADESTAGQSTADDCASIPDASGE